MMRKVLLIAVALVLVFVPAIGCSTDEDDNGNGGVTPPPDPIKIGIVVDSTGALAAMGSLIGDAAKLAFDKINDAGGINGAKIEYYIEDGKTDPTAGFEAIKKLALVNGCKIIIGPMISGASLAAGPWALENKVLLISPSATSPDIAQQDWRQFFHRTAPTDRLQGAAIAQLVLDEGYQRVAIMVMDNQYGAGIADVVAEQLAGQAEIVTTIKYDPVKADYLTELQIIKDANPDVVVHTGYADDSIIVFGQALDLGLENIPWITSEGVYSPQTLAVAKSAQFMAAAVTGTRLTAPEGLEAFAQFASEYEAAYGSEPGVYNDTVYDAAMLVIEALKNVGDDATLVAAEILNIAQGYAGVSGSITLDEWGDRVSGDFEVWKVVPDGDGFAYERIKVISIS